MIRDSERCGTSFRSVSRGPDMARGNAANASAHAEALHRLAGTSAFDAATAQAAFLGIKRLEIWVRRGVPAMVMLFICALAAMTVAMARDSYDRTIADAMSDLELLAAVVADDFRDFLKQTPKSEVEASLADAVPARALARGQQALISDLSGDVVAAIATASAVKGALTDYLGPAQPLTVFAEKAGVMRITLADGSDVLATVRTLPPPFGQIAVVHPISAVLAEWRATAARSAVLIVSAAFVLLALAFAYFWQASRAR